MHGSAADARRGAVRCQGAGVHRAELTLSREGQVTDRYTKAIEQLGSDELDVPIGGIYALERVARDSARDHPTAMEVLTAFIREHSREPWPEPEHPGGQERNDQRDPTFKPPSRWSGAGSKAATFSASTSGGRGPHPREPRPREPQRPARHSGADFRARRLREDLSRAGHPSGAVVAGADLSDANLTGADLSRREPHRREPHRREPPRRGPSGVVFPRGPHPRGLHRRSVVLQ